jgi:hypothetical protein
MKNQAYQSGYNTFFISLPTSMNGARKACRARQTAIHPAFAATIWKPFVPFATIYAHAISPHSMTLTTCRPGCGACCIAPSISSPIPGMPDGKPAQVKCSQLADDLRCNIFGKPERPSCCSGLQASEEMCGNNREHAMHWLTRLEQATTPFA